MDNRKKRVLYFVPEFPRISETFIEREISQLVKWNNLDITVLSLARASGSTSEGVTKRVVYKRLGILGFLKGLTYLTSCPAKTIQCYKLAPSTKDRSFLSKTYFFLKSLGYAKIISDLKPEHIHVHFLSWPSTTVLIASTVLDIPFSISAHAKDVFVEGELIAQKIKSAKFVSICNSYAHKKALGIAGQDANASKVKLIYHGIDPNIFNDPSKRAKPTVPSIFLGGTRLVEKKGLRYMIEASKILKDAGVEHRVDLVGPGPLYQEFINQINKLNLNNTVFIHGNNQGTPFEEVVEYYKTADIFVLPSIETNDGDADGVPTVVIEAAMAKLPIISTNAGGIADLIQDGVTGIVVEQKNPKAIANTIQQLLSNKDLAKKLAQNAYEKAVQMFDIQKNVGQLEELLK